MYEDDIYLFYQLISEASPKSVIDFGLTLDKRGVLARNHNGFCLDEIILDGVSDSSFFPISRILYNQIYNSPVDIPNKQHYDLGFFLFSEQIDWNWATNHCRNFISTVQPKSDISFKTIPIDDKVFYLCKSREN